MREVAGEEIYQVVVGSSANPGLRDFAVVAAIMRGRQAHPQVSLDVNPTSRQVLADLTKMGATTDLIESGARPRLDAWATEPRAEEGPGGR